MISYRFNYLNVIILNSNSFKKPKPHKIDFKYICNLV